MLPLSPVSNGRPQGISPHTPLSDFTSGAHREGAVLLGNPLFLLPPSLDTRYLETRRAYPLAFRESDSTRRRLSGGIFFVAIAAAVPEISPILWRKAL
ncbi:hypothetical protein PISMIDRAFT_14865 [Pisolithus microcarpus 441]|uniref:Uncharacterized protein n=1 Tax=Pisolithus microcarpus 441 TaxID=765257 RepID=A0A0C9XZ15_9AGAM|nr:hypothetical protein PISMIDRAFT_14865 [Pisolithus microcarpus 441]